MNKMIISEAMNGQPCSRLDTRSLTSRICVELARATALAGTSAEANDLKFAAVEIAKEIVSNYQSLTLAELAIAIDEGVKGRFGEYFGINVVTVVRWFDAYIRSDERKECLRERGKLIELKYLSDRTHLSSEEKHNLRRSHAISKFNKYLETGELVDYGNCVYKFLVEQKVLTTSNDYKRRVYEVAKRQVIANLNSYINGNSSFRHILSLMRAIAKANVIGRFFRQRRLLFGSSSNR